MVVLFGEFDLFIIKYLIKKLFIIIGFVFFDSYNFFINMGEMGLIVF